MDKRGFDGMTREFTTAPRRRVLGGLGATIVAVVAGRTAADDAGAIDKDRRRTRRRRRHRLRTVCFADLTYRVREPQAIALVEAGGRPGVCAPPGGDPGGGPGSDPTCEVGKLPCNTVPSPCGDANSGCACVVNTIGQNVCILPPPVCLGQRSTCTVDSDCEQYGGGVCVPMWGCSGYNCGGNGNACAPVCSQT